MKAHALTVADLMTTAVISVRGTETVRAALADMQMGAFRHLPVLDERGHLIGILSDRDILRTLQLPHPIPVAEVMTRDVVTVRPTTPAHKAAMLLLEHKIGSVPVVDDSGALVGMLTETDFVEVSHRALLGQPLARP